MGMMQKITIDKITIKPYNASIPREGILAFSYFLDRKEHTKYETDYNHSNFVSRDIINLDLYELEQRY